MRTRRILVTAVVLAAAATLTPVLNTSANALVAKNCVTSQLGVRVGTPQGAAGTIYYPVIFTNRGAACALWGVPHIQPVVGGPAHRRIAVGPPARNVSLGQMPVRLVVAHGRSVSDAFGVSESGNYPTNVCRAATARAIVVTLSPFVAATLLGLNISVCTRQASTSTRLLAPGTSGA